MATYTFNWDFLPKYQNFFIDGLISTIGLAAIAVIIGVILGTFLALMKISKFKILRFLSSCYIEFIRGTPALVQIYFIFYGLPLLLGVEIESRFLSGAIALGLNSAAYVGEIIRSGIQAVDSGQMEAARSLGMSQGLSMVKIIMPQAIKNILPALGNEFIVVIKESSMVSIIGVGELMYKTKTIMGNTYQPFEPLIIASIMYFILTFSLSKLLGIYEQRLKRSDRIWVKH